MAEARLFLYACDHILPGGELQVDQITHSIITQLVRVDNACRSCEALNIMFPSSQALDETAPDEMETIRARFSRDLGLGMLGNYHLDNASLVLDADTHSLSDSVEDARILFPADDAASPCPVFSPLDMDELFDFDGAKSPSVGSPVNSSTLFPSSPSPPPLPDSDSPSTIPTSPPPVIADPPLPRRRGRPRKSDITKTAKKEEEKKSNKNHEKLPSSTDSVVHGHEYMRTEHGPYNTSSSDTWAPRRSNRLLKKSSPVPSPSSPSPLSGDQRQ